MFDTFNGLPVHPLVVHGVVVLLPLAIIGTIAIAVRPAWRATYGPLVAVIAVIGTAMLPIATSSGESLEKQVGDPGSHADLGDQLLWFTLPLVVLVVLLVLFDRIGRQGGLMTVVAVAAVVAALVCGVQVYRVGDSGARAAWGDKVSSAP